MQSCKSCTSCKTVLVWSGKLSIGRFLLIGSLVFLTSLTSINAASLRASPCTLAWNTCTNSAVSGYAVYYGVTGSTTTNRLDAGLTNQVTFKNFYAFTNYFFCVVAYNASGIESPRSAVMYYTAPAVSSLKVGYPTNGTMKVCFQAGTNTACHIEYSNSIQPLQWQTLTSATADVNGNVSIIDPLIGKPPSRYYRVVVP
jgi:hypothetical protein